MYLQNIRTGNTDWYRDGSGNNSSVFSLIRLR